MKKIIISAFFISIVATFLFVAPSFAQTSADETRYAECDLCGYCNGKEPPSTWNECRTCIYPAAPSPASTKETLKIDLQTNLPPTPAKGRFYTQIGCITTNVDDFTKPEGAAVLVNSILNRLIFPTVGGIALLYLIYGAFTLITSQSNPEKLQQGKTMVVGAIIGLIFTLSVVLIVNIVAGQILKAPGFNEEETNVTISITPTP